MLRRWVVIIAASAVASVAGGTSTDGGTTDPVAETVAAGAPEARPALGRSERSERDGSTSPTAGPVATDDSASSEAAPAPTATERRERSSPEPAPAPPPAHPLPNRSDLAAVPQESPNAPATPVAPASPTMAPVPPAPQPASPTASAPGADAAPAPVRPPLALGISHTERSLDSWGDPGSVAAGEALLAAHPGTLQNVHLMGWGTTNPEPSPGQFVWRDLDRRLALVTRTGGTPVITLCCAPDWMKGGAPGTTDWSLLEKAPSPEHFADFAELARLTALRYPQVRHFQVWNELKGFHDATRNRWRYEDYTTLYNLVYDAVKSVNPANQVGGPYVIMKTWAPGSASHPSALAGSWGVVDQRALDVIDHWLRHARGADFIAVDGAPTGAATIGPDQAAEYFGAVNQWIRARTQLPIWWSELYPIPFADATTPVDQRTRAWSSALRRLDETGASVALLWQPETRSGAAWMGLWTDTSISGGGRPTALCTVICAQLRRHP